jgi:hypothetical protein
VGLEPISHATGLDPSIIIMKRFKRDGEKEEDEITGKLKTLIGLLFSGICCIIMSQKINLNVKYLSQKLVFQLYFPNC